MILGDRTRKLTEGNTWRGGKQCDRKFGFVREPAGKETLSRFYDRKVGLHCELNLIITVNCEFSIAAIFITFGHVFRLLFADRMRDADTALTD